VKWRYGAEEFEVGCECRTTILITPIPGVLPHGSEAHGVT
jgi:hypothetical protein